MRTPSPGPTLRRPGTGPAASYRVAVTTVTTTWVAEPADALGPGSVPTDPGLLNPGSVLRRVTA